MKKAFLRVVLLLSAFSVSTLVFSPAQVASAATNETAPANSIFSASSEGMRVEFSGLALVDERTGASLFRVEKGVLRRMTGNEPEEKGIHVSLAGVAPGTFFEDENPPAMDVSLPLRFDEKRGTLSMERAFLRIKDVGTLRVTVALSGIDPGELFRSFGTKKSASLLGASKIERMTVEWNDEGFRRKTLSRAPDAGRRPSKENETALRVLVEKAASKGISFTGVEEFSVGERNFFSMSTGTSGNGTAITVSDVVEFLVEESK